MSSAPHKVVQLCMYSSIPVREIHALLTMLINLEKLLKITILKFYKEKKPWQNYFMNMKRKDIKKLRATTRWPLA
jgi:hypothetical protein